ncbi:hypothetical protein AGMMS49982_01460 [Bacteroidia bacterium]|nr:hypothetical protein AGMMS49982_01460 [Bacteroidia bacterium]
MKKIFYSVMAAALILGGCAEDKETVDGAGTGTIYGVITDKATGEPVRAAGVQLLPLGVNTVTFDDGHYEYPELKPGEYTLNVTKTEYTDISGYAITVESGKTAKGDMQMVKLPPSLRIVDDSKKDISLLDFSNTSATSKSFNVFNDGPVTLQWEIVESSNWFSVNQKSGTLTSGSILAIIVTIDKSKITGSVTDNIFVTSNNGNKSISIKANSSN